MPGEERTRDLRPEIAEPDRTEQTPSFERSMAVIIGINDYGHGIPPLTTPVKDAGRLAKLLEKEHNYEVRLLVNQEAAKEKLQTLFSETLPGQVNENDRLLVYFAGHGTVLDREDERERGEFVQVPYLIPYGADPHIRDTFLPMDEFHDWLTALKCRHMLLILDCCFAGAIRWSGFRGARPHPKKVYRERYELFIRSPAWQAITSAAYDQRVLDVAGGHVFGKRSGKDDEQHSPFALALFDALSGVADAYPPPSPGRPAGDGLITAYELIEYIRAEVVRMAKEQGNHAQMPGLWPLKHHAGEFVFLNPKHPSLILDDAPGLTPETNPYRGLESFDEKHDKLFFGRDDQIACLVEQVISHPFTAVLGASGAGKSSLVKAGLIPRLGGSHKPGTAVECVQQEDLPHHWFILPPFCPTDRPLLKLSRTLAEHLSGYQEHTTLNALRHHDTALAELVQAWSCDHPDCKLLLVVDQFEQLITLCKDEKEREQFLSLLAQAVETQAEHIHLIITLRTDFEPQFRNATPLSTHWSDARYIVPPMSQDDLREVIEGPAWVKELYFEPELVDELINDVNQMPGALPLLSFALSELYDTYVESSRTDRTLRMANYEALGRVAGSLRKRANRVYEDLPDNLHRDSMRHILLRMVALEGGGVARRRVSAKELVYPCTQENQQVSQVTNKLVEAKLVVPGNEDDGEIYYEPAHDALEARGWRALALAAAGDPAC